jgi:hypothetical protein
MRELLRSVAPAVDPAALDVEIGPWLAGMTQLYRLTNPAAGRFKELAACRIIVATSQGVYRVQTNLQQTELLAGLRILAHDEVYTALLSTPGGALAGVSSQGKFILVDAEGIVSRMRQVTASALSMAHVLWHGRSCFVLSGQDKQIRLLDETGDVVARFSVPALLLPLAAQEVNGELWLAGGVRYQNQIYAWNLSRVMQGHADAPVILRAGKSPASHLRFVSLGGQCWLLQGCCDGHVHLYSWPQPARRKLAPEYTLCGAEALRTLEPLTVQGRSYLFGGTESGRLVAWALNEADLDAQPAFGVSQLNARITCLASANIAGQEVLFAGCGDGCLVVLKLPRVAPGLPLSTVRVGEGPVCGIGFTWPVAYETLSMVA